jgi:8-oxo-dGTP diphosphatase
MSIQKSYIRVEVEGKIGYLSPFPPTFCTSSLIIEYRQGAKEGIILIRRGNEPHKGKLALPGGFLEERLDLGENGVKEAKEETGLEISIEDPNHPFCVKSHPDRDPRAHIVDHIYIAKGRGTLVAGDDAAGAKLYTLVEVATFVRNRQLAFDHGEILGEYLECRRQEQ